MAEFLQYGALALCVMAFILLKLSGREQKAERKPLFGRRGNEANASRTAFVLCAVIAIGASFLFLDGEFTVYSRFGPTASSISLDANPGEFYFYLFLLVVLPALVAIWEGVKLLKRH